ncbi:PTS system IID component (Man family) [Alkalibaculum bacchi]|uniref:PTS system IID component (Man family) n=1 Tax=Alkalibaculum bacchi TaxID=645887 RepID=A0A366I6X3_9FIRM|nr:PTS system mannose/fructose/sorbose family transporter subunit IID [Alkalibaculum bacchi]RBP63337.1 PTS system IID component (Man family) [Alkalibaculum bacchi]
MSDTKGIKKISKKTLNKSFWLWFYGHQVCYSLELMQTLGYMTAMNPVIDELYDTNEEKRDALNTYSTFFNTEPQLGTVVVGITAGLEEARANGENVDDEMIAGIRSGLMGPIAGIGDSLIVGTLIPILLGIGLGLSTGGSPLGAIFYIVVWNLIAILGMKFLYFKGYELGGKAVEVIVGEKAKAIRESIVMVGTVVIGAVSASWVNVTTALKMTNPEGEVIIDLQNTLDGIFPKLLTVLTVLFCWWLMAKKKMGPTKVMGLLVVIAFIGVLLGIFDPGLTY